MLGVEGDLSSDSYYPPLNLFKQVCIFVYVFGSID